MNSTEQIITGIICGVIGGLSTLLIPRKKCSNCGIKFFKFSKKCPKCKTEVP
jgi:hypothetical protein